MFSVLKIISSLLCFLPRYLVYYISSLFGIILFLLNIFRINICMANIKVLLNENIKNKEALKIIAKMYIHFSKCMIDFMRIPIYSKKLPNNFIEIEGEEFFKKVMLKNKGAFFIMGHIGNWELLGLAFKELGVTSGKVVVKSIRNKSINNFINNFRQKANLEPVMNKNSTAKILKWIKEKSFIGFVIDQNMNEEYGVFVDFGKRKASTLKAPAILAKRYKVPVLGVSLVRKKDNNYKLIISEEINLYDTDNSEEDVLKNTQLFSNFIYSIIQKYPEQWIWMHRRFKLQPKGVDKLYR